MMVPPQNFSSSGSTGDDQCVVHHQTGIFTIFYSIVFIIALPGSLMSLFFFVRSRRVKHEQQSCRVYLLNLLTSDLLLLIVLPFNILKESGAAKWNLLVFHCQISAVIIYISLYASIAFIALIITDCYLQECSSVISLRLRSFSLSLLVSLVIWLLLLLLMVPNMVLPTKDLQVQPYLRCSSLKKEFGLHWHTLTVFLNTALFLNATAAVVVSCVLTLRLVLCNHSNPVPLPHVQQVAARVTVLAVAFMMSFVPYHAVRTPYTLTQTNVITDCSTKRKLFISKEATLLLSLLHLCCHPLLFWHLSTPFRMEVQRIFTCSKKEGEENEENMQLGAPSQSVPVTSAAPPL